MSFVVGALEALANVFDVIFERLNALDKRADVLDKVIDRFADTIDKAATHAAQYAVEVKFEDLDLESNLSSTEILQGDVESLKFSVHELENDMHLVRCQDARVDSLEREIKALKASHQAQDKTIKALLKALEWEPPKD